MLAITLLLIATMGVYAWMRQHKTYEDVTQVIQSLQLPEQLGEYASVTWMNSHQIIYIFAESSDPYNQELAVYNIQSQTHHSLLMELRDGCNRSYLSRLTQLPDETIGMLLRCSTGIASREYEVISINPATGERKLLYRYPEGFSPATYSFAPDMNRALHSERRGMANNYIYVVGGSSEPQQLFALFEHTAEPRWSPQGDQIGFFAVRGDSEEAVQDSRLRGIATLVAGWDLMIAPPDEQEARVVLRNVQFPHALNWLPAGDKLAFSGEYQGKPGIWLLDLNSDELFRLWHETASFAVSPDGQKLVLIQVDLAALDEGVDKQSLVLLSLTHLLEE
jgi:Tol biopolymer transport system component